MLRIIGQKHKKQSGQALILTLVVLVLSSVIIIPLVNMVNTGMKNTQLYQQNAKGIYAADAGIQYALWKITYPSQITIDRSKNTYPANPYTYTPPAINNNTLNVDITANWLFYYLFRLSLGNMPKSANLFTTYTANNGIFTITFENIDQPYYNAQPINIQKMGVWLPSGFKFVNNSCYSTYFTSPNLNTILSTQLVYGGTNLIWTPPNPGYSLGKNQTATLQFNYTPATGTVNGAGSWIFPSQSSYGAAWDNAVWWYNVTSTAVDNSTGKTTTIDATVTFDPDKSVTSLVAYNINPVTP